jgi:hypothetical protein
MESQGAMEPWDYFEDISNLKDEIEDCGFFEAPTMVRHRWVRKYSAESYAGLFRTYSDFLSLPKKTQGRIACRIKEIIKGNGGEVTRTYDSIMLHAMRK